MSIDLKFNPEKSFRFVRLFTNMVSLKAEIRAKSQLKRVKETARSTMPSPKEIRNATMRTNIKIQGYMTPHDRFIDIMV